MNELDEFVGKDKESSFYEKALHAITFNLSLIFKNIRNRRRSMTIIVLGLIFSMSMLFTASIWTETSQKIIADDYIETLDYELYVSTFLTNAMEPVFEYALNDELVKQVDWYYPTVGLFNFEDKGDYYRWYPENSQDNMSNPLSITHAHIVSTRAIERIKINLEVEGNATLNSGEILMSYTQAKQLEVIYNKTIVPGDKFNVAITRKIPNTDMGEHQMRHYDIDDTTFYNYTISGIFKYIGHNTVISKLLGGIGSSGGTLLDSIFFPLDDLVPTDRYIMDSNALLPRLLVKTDAEQLRANGINNMPDTLLALKERIEIRFFHAFTSILSQEIQTMADEYARTFGSTSLFVPALTAAVFLTIVSSQMTIKKRKEEIAFLRSKGAVSIQIIGMFFGEFFLLSTFSLVVSLGVGVLLSAAIPAFGHGSFFSNALFKRYLQELVISPVEIEIYAVLVLGTYLGVTLLNVINFVRKDIHESLIMTRRGQRLLVMWVKIVAFILTFAGFIFLIIDNNSRSRGQFGFGFGMITDSSQTLLVFIGVIFFSSYFISQGLNYILRKLERVYKFVFKKDSFLLFQNIKRHSKSLTDLTFFLILIICLITMLMTIRSTTLYNQAIEDEYRMGADIRIQSLVPVNISEFEEILIEIDGISNITGFQSIRAGIGSQTIDVFGTDPSKYLSIGRWIDSSFTGMTPDYALAELENNRSGVILSDYSAERLDLEIGQMMSVSDFRGGHVPINFVVSAIIGSAPGLGVAHGHDPKMNRDTTEWVLLNREVLVDSLDIHNGTLFLASAEEGADIEQIKQEIETMFPLMKVNPEQINPDYIGYFIVRYIPPVAITLFIGAIVLNIIGVVYILISTDFILEQRRRENAVILALGGNQRRIRKMQVSEVAIFLVATIVIGIPLGIVFAILSLTFLKPLLIPREVVQMTLHIDALALIILIGTLCIAALLSIIPLIRKQMKYEIVQELRAII